MALIDSEIVTATFMACLFRQKEIKEGEIPKNAVIAEGITGKVGFHPDRVKENEKIISQMLDCLPEQFHEKSGGGWSFLNACMDKNEEQWTGLHKIMNELFCLGMAIGKVECLMPREMWSALPGGMPYYVVKEVKHG